MSLLWIKAIQFGSDGQSLGSIRIFGQLVSTRMGLKGCCCLKEQKKKPQSIMITHGHLQALNWIISKTTVVWMLTSNIQVYNRGIYQF